MNFETSMFLGILYKLSTSDLPLDSVTATVNFQRGTPDVHYLELVPDISLKMRSILLGIGHF